MAPITLVVHCIGLIPRKRDLLPLTHTTMNQCSQKQTKSAMSLANPQWASLKCSINCCSVIGHSIKSRFNVMTFIFCCINLMSFYVLLHTEPITLRNHRVCIDFRHIIQLMHSFEGWQKIYVNKKNASILLYDFIGCIFPTKIIFSCGTRLLG